MPSVILAAALDAFCERGFGSTPVPMVAERAGVAAGTIYRYFPGKKGLVNALYQHWKGALSRELLEGLSRDAPARQAFAEVWRRLVGFAVAYPRAFLFLETHHHAAYLDDASRAVSRDLDAAITAVLRAWQSRGEVRAGDPDVLVALVYGGFVGVVRQHSERGLALSDRLYEETVHATWAALAPPDASSASRKRTSKTAPKSGARD